jgi:hypothetical protein
MMMMHPTFWDAMFSFNTMNEWWFLCNGRDKQKELAMVKPNFCSLTASAKRIRTICILADCYYVFCYYYLYCF